MDALDLAPVLEVPGDVGVLRVERLAFQQRGQAGPRLAAQARGFLLLALGRDPLVLFLLGTDRIGLGQVDVLAATASGGRPLATALARAVGPSLVRRLFRPRRLG